VKLAPLLGYLRLLLRPLRLRNLSLARKFGLAGMGWGSKKQCEKFWKSSLLPAKRS
jgi:hypothetical protein